MVCYCSDYNVYGLVANSVSSSFSLRLFPLYVGLPDSLFDWTREPDTGILIQDNIDQILPSKRHWHLVSCQNGKLMYLFLSSLLSIPRHAIDNCSFSSLFISLQELLNLN